MFVLLVALSPVSLGFPSGVCAAGGVVTCVVGDFPLVFVVLVALSPLSLVVCYLVSVGMACFTHRHSVVVTGSTKGVCGLWPIGGR